MSIHEKLTSAMEKVKNQIELEEKAEGSPLTTDLGAALYSQTVIPKTKTSEYLRAAIGWVYGCVGVISDEVASIQLHMLNFKGGELIEIDEHPALDVIYRANNAMTRFDLIQLTFEYLELTGEAPWYISFKNSKPDQIFLLRPDRLTVLPGKDGELIGGYKYKVYKDGGAYEEIKLETFEVIPLRYCDPDNPVRGKGPLQASARTVDLENYAEKWNSQFFANSASPSAAFQTDKTLGKEIRQRLENKIKEKYQGVKNAHKTLILEGGLKYQQLALSQKDMDFVLQQQMSRDKILSIFRVPPTALGLTADVTRANAEATDYVFAKRTIKPKMLRFVEQLNEFFLPLFGENTNTLYFDFDDPVPENVDQDIAKAASGVQNGYMTINEAREIAGFDPVPDGDILRDPTSMQPVLNFNQQPLKAAGKKAFVRSYYKHMNKARNRKHEYKDKQRKAIEAVVQESITPLIANLLLQKSKTPKVIRAVKKSVFVSGTWEEVVAAKYDFQEKQLKLADEFEPRFMAKLDQVFTKQKEIILRGLDNGEKMKLKPETEAERYEKTLHSVFMELLKEQAALAFQLLGIQKSVTQVASKGFTQTLSDYFSSRTFTFGAQVARETNDKLGAQFAEAAQKEESIPQIKSRITSLFDDMKGYRSERIARSEVIRGSNYATEQAYIDSGVVEAKEWLATKDERTDDECMQMDGKVVSLGDNYFNKGDTFGGLTLDYENVQYPPLHVNCRCTLIPVISAAVKPGVWRPSMIGKEQDVKAFIKDSVYKGDLYHGTTGGAGDNIVLNGFNPNHPGGTGSDIIEGVYVTKQPQLGVKYAMGTDEAVLSKTPKDTILSLVKSKVNLGKIRTLDGKDMSDELFKNLGANFTGKMANEYFAKQGYDAVVVNNSPWIGDYMVILDPRKMIVTGLQKFSVGDVLLGKFKP